MQHHPGGMDRFALVPKPNIRVCDQVYTDETGISKQAKYGQIRVQFMERSPPLNSSTNFITTHDGRFWVRLLSTVLSFHCSWFLSLALSLVGCYVTRIDAWKHYGMRVTLFLLIYNIFSIVFSFVNAKVMLHIGHFPLPLFFFCFYIMQYPRFSRITPRD